MAKQTKPAHVYDTVEIQSGHLILSLGDGRIFNVALPELPEGELPAQAELDVPELDDTGCPQGATFKRFI